MTERTRTVLVFLAIALPVPLVAASGLVVPVPSLIANLAASLVSSGSGMERSASAQTGEIILTSAELELERSQAPATQASPSTGATTRSDSTQRPAYVLEVHAVDEPAVPTEDDVSLASDRAPVTPEGPEASDEPVRAATTPLGPDPGNETSPSVEEPARPDDKEPDPPVVKPEDREIEKPTPDAETEPAPTEPKPPPSTLPPAPAPGPAPTPTAVKPTSKAGGVPEERVELPATASPSTASKASK